MAWSSSTLSSVSSPAWRFSGAPAAVDVEEGRDGVEAEAGTAAGSARAAVTWYSKSITDGPSSSTPGCRRRISSAAPRQLRRTRGAFQIPHLLRLIAWPIWKRGPYGAKRGPISSRAPAPAGGVAHQLAVLRQGEGQLEPAGVERPRQLLLGRRGRPPRGGGAAARGATPSSSTRASRRLRRLRPGADADAEPREVDRRRVKLPLELAVAPPDPGQGAGDHGGLHGVGAGVGEAHPQLVEPAGVLVRLVREAVPDHLVARSGAGRGVGDVGVRPPRQQQAASPGRASRAPASSIRSSRGSRGGRRGRAPPAEPAPGSPQ